MKTLIPKAEASKSDGQRPPSQVRWVTQAWADGGKWRTQLW